MHGASFKNRPHSLNNRLFQVPEAMEEPLGNNFELNATGFGGMRAPPIANKKNSQRLARDMQQFKELDQLENLQRQFDLAMLDKKAKDAIQANQKKQAIDKLKKLGKDAPLNKYYREQINKNSIEINATGLQGAITQTQIGTGQTPKNVLQASAMRIAQPGSGLKP